jgi:hypothetical protein
MMFPASISIKQIALAFITGLLVLMSLIAGFAAYQTRRDGSVEQHKPGRCPCRTRSSHSAASEPDPGSG